MFSSYAWFLVKTTRDLEQNLHNIISKRGTISMYQTSDSDNLAWHVITQAAEYSKDWKLVKKS